MIDYINLPIVIKQGHFFRVNYNHGFYTSIERECLYKDDEFDLDRKNFSIIREEFNGFSSPDEYKKKKYTCKNELCFEFYTEAVKKLLELALERESINNCANI